MRPPTEPALAVVTDYLATLDTATPAASRALRRQRAWALREAVLFAAARHLVDVTTGNPLTDTDRTRAEQTRTTVLLHELLQDDFAEHWSTHADPVLRGLPGGVAATRRARLTSLRALAAFAGAGLPAHREGKPALRGLLTRPQVDVALRALAAPLPGRGPHDHVRLAAILAVVAQWPARSHALSDLRVSQLQDDGTGVTLLGVVPDGSPSPVLRGTSARRLREWLAVRDELVSALLGGPVHTLWVSIRSNSRPGGPRGSLPLPPGMPLRPRGLQRAYARSVEAANLVHAGAAGFPLPRSLDLLRRSVQEPPAPGASTSPTAAQGAGQPTSAGNG